MSENNNPRVVITGISACAPNGVGANEFSENVLQGVSGCKEVSTFDLDNKSSTTAGIIDKFKPETLFSLDNAKSYNPLQEDRMLLLAEFCIEEAIKSANLKDILEKKNDVSLFLATAIGPMTTMEYNFIQKNILKGISSTFNGNHFSFANCSKLLANKFNLNGNYLTIPTGCVAGCDSISYAVNKIRNSQVDCVLVGAAEAPITPLVVNAFGKINATSTRRCLPHKASSPFDIKRDGFVIGEGCGIIVLESEEHAKSRGARILAEIKGTGSINNCFHMTDIASNGDYIKESCKLALADAGISEFEIDYINAHASSTIQNDLAESNAFNSLFGKRISSIPVTGIKSQIGHALSASNAIEIVSATQTLNHNKIPPTINLTSQDPMCRLKVVKDNYIESEVYNILKTSSGFSGIHTAIILSRYN